MIFIVLFIISAHNEVKFTMSCAVMCCLVCRIATTSFSRRSCWSLLTDWGHIAPPSVWLWTSGWTRGIETPTPGTLLWTCSAHSACCCWKGGSPRTRWSTTSATCELIWLWTVSTVCTGFHFVCGEFDFNTRLQDNTAPDKQLLCPVCVHRAVRLQRAGQSSRTASD